MIWLLFVTSVFSGEVIHHRIPLPDLATCRAVASGVGPLLENLGAPALIAPGLLVIPTNPAFPRPVCRPASGPQ